MSETTTTENRAQSAGLHPLLRAGAVAAAGFALGALTFYAQGFLPESVVSFANSASGWTLLTVLLIAAARLPAGHSAALGAVAFVLMVLGYSAAAQLNGLFYSPVFFGAIGVVAGPFVGAATVWLRSPSLLRAAVATALLAGIGLGEGVYGLTVVAATTSPVYWVASAVAGLALLAAMLLRRLRGVAPITVAVAGTALIAGAFILAYTAAGTVITAF